MKKLFILILVFSCINTIVAAELQVEDLGKIREIVKEVEVRLEKRIADVETKLEKRLTDVETKLEKRIAESEKRLDKSINDRFTEQSKRLDYQGTLVITLIGAVIAFVGIPLILIAYQQNRRTQQDDVIRVHTAEIQALREKIDSLEEKRIVGA